MLVFGTLLILSDVSLLTSLRTSLVVISISTTGLIAWLLVMRDNREVLFPEAIGMGLAFGFIFVLVSTGVETIRVQYFWWTDPDLCRSCFAVFRTRSSTDQLSAFKFFGDRNRGRVIHDFFGLYLNAPLILIPSAIFAYVAFGRKESINKNSANGQQKSVTSIFG